MKQQFVMTHTIHQTETAVLLDSRVTNTPSVKMLSIKKLLLLIQGGSNMTGTDLCVNKPHCAAAVRP